MDDGIYVDDAVLVFVWKFEKIESIYIDDDVLFGGVGWIEVQVLNLYLYYDERGMEFRKNG